MDGRTVKNVEYTDRAVLVGPNIRWLQDDYDDFQQFYPEVFLGLRTTLVTYDLLHRAITGGPPIRKAVLVDTGNTPEWKTLEARGLLVPSMLEFGGVIEEWYVHRALGFERLARYEVGGRVETRA